MTDRMIEVENINEIPFPVLDFKFVNRGHASAVLYQIGVSVIDIEVDPTPVLSVRAVCRPDSLEILGVNNGWGPANKTSVESSNPLLCALFPYANQATNVQIDSGEVKCLLTYTFSETTELGLDSIRSCLKERKRLLSEIPARMNDQDKTLLQEEWFQKALCSHEQWHLVEYFDDLGKGRTTSDGRQKWHVEYMSNINQIAVPINEIPIHGECYDIRGHKHDFQDRVAFGIHSYGCGAQLWIKEDGFEYEHYMPPNYCLLPPTMAAVVMLDNRDGERTYSVSIEIHPGRAERFHVVVGGHKSYRAKVKIRFHFDAGQVVESDTFEIKVWLPRNKAGSIFSRICDGSHFVKVEKGWRLTQGPM